MLGKPGAGMIALEEEATENRQKRIKFQRTVLAAASNPQKGLSSWHPCPYWPRSSLKACPGEFPGGAVAGTPRSHCQGPGSIPG